MAPSAGRPSMLIAYPIAEQAIALARSRALVDLHESTDALSPRELAERLRGQQGLVCLITDRIDDALLSACPDLRVVSNVAVGFNNVDVPAATRRGIVITNTPDVLTDTTADYAWALLMATARRVVEADRFVRQGQWTKWEFNLFIGNDVHGSTLGIVGFGRIGRAMARRAAGFGMRVLYQDPVGADAEVERELRATRADLPTLLRESDFVTVHTPLLADTRHLISAEALRSMKRTAYLVNAARGPVVDVAALLAALKAGTIAGAGLDVFEVEPGRHEEFAGLDNVVLAPHIASGSFATRIKMATLAVENCLAVLEGTMPPTPVNPEVLRAR